ncbi:MAG TPA: GDSL-type esterase/lipase family protein [Candidatus Pristimantibacillus sp.]|nr:GDSL-type esterase/lipase family protein [Candidatus Pristimantibacillus sp.]
MQSEHDVRILVFGDSIAYGAWDTEGGWVDRLKRDAHRQTVATGGKPKLQVVNLGVGGNSSTKILKRLKAEIEARKSASWPLVFVFAFGTNDQRVTDGQIEVAYEQFEANVRDIIKLAKGYTSRIIFVGPPPLAKHTVTLKDQEYVDQRLRDYEDAMQRIVQEEGLPFVRTRPAFEQEGTENLFAHDGLHPNDRGHYIIYDQVAPWLEEMVTTSMPVNDEGRFQVGVGAVLERPDGKVLMIKRVGSAVGGGVWEFPIGRLKQFEPIEDGLRREVHEETGISNLELVMPLTTFTFMRGGETAENELKGITFWCRTKDAEPRTSEEHDGWQWVTADEAIDLTTHQGIKDDLKTFKEFRERLQKT